MLVFYASGLLLKINCVITLPKFTAQPRTAGQTHKKTDVSMSFTITRPPNVQMSGINEGERRRKLALNKDK